MKTSLVIKLIIIIAVIAGLGYILYKDYYKTKDFVFEAKIKEVVVNDNVYTTIFYLNKDVMGQQIANLVKIIGQDELIKRTGGSSKTIEFKLQSDMKLRE